MSEEIRELKDALWRYEQYPHEGRFTLDEIRKMRKRLKELEEVSE